MFHPPIDMFYTGVTWWRTWVKTQDVLKRLYPYVGLGTSGDLPRRSWNLMIGKCGLTSQSLATMFTMVCSGLW